jgi:hypothetical protein
VPTVSDGEDRIAREREALEAIIGRARSEEPWPANALPAGTRVRVVKDQDWDGPWAREFTGTIDTVLPPSRVEHPMARPDELAYFVKFDEPEHDHEGDGPYSKAEIWDRYLRPLDAL